MTGANTDAPIGIFGFYKSLTVVFDGTPSGRLMAQDLASTEALDITDAVRLDGNRLILDGGLISKTGLSAARTPEHETPGLVLKFVEIG